MPVTDLSNAEEEIFEPQVLYIVDVDNDTAIASIERDSLAITLNEENAEFEPHSSRNIITSATTTNPQVSFTLTRNINNEAFDALGIRDTEAEDGLYVRGDGRKKGRIELWYYEDDADPTTEDAQMVDAFEDVRFDVSGDLETSTNVATVEVTMHVNGDAYFNTTSSLAGDTAT